MNEIEEKKTMFIHTNQPLFTPFYLKKITFFAEFAMMISADPQLFALRAREC